MPAVVTEFTVLESLERQAASCARSGSPLYASLLTGLQTMPSVAWSPLAILLFQLSEAAILAVVVPGAAPSIAIGLLTSTDQVSPLLVRAGKVMGARGLALYRHIILPAALPGFVAGLKQGWAFAWRSLMAGELLVIIGHAPSIGVRLQFSRELSDAEGLLAWMLVVMIMGVLVDGLVFGVLERKIREALLSLWLEFLQI